MKEKASYFYQHMRQVHMDFHMPEFPVNAINNFNAKDFVDNLLRGKINMVALFAKCHFGNSFYNTKVGHKHSGLKEDFLMETAIECEKNDIFTYAYYSLCTDVKAYREHANWRYVDAEGKYSGINGPWAFLCPNTPYKEELVLPQLEEIIKDYPINALWIDIPFPIFSSSQDTCFCQYCKEKFKTMYNKELSMDIPLDERMAFMEASTAIFLREIKVLIQKHKKCIKLATNCCSIDRSRVFTHENDILVWESQPREGYLSHSFVCRHVRTLDLPCQVMSVRFYSGWGDLTLKPAAQMTTEFAVMIGNGCAATSGDQVNVDGTLQSAVYDMFNESFGFVQDREEILRTAYSVKDTAILVPAPSVDRPALKADNEDTRGAHKALLESQIQFDILSSLDKHLYDDYKCIILPGQGGYPEDVHEKLRDWVENGGTLIAVGSSMIKDGKFISEDIFGLEYLEPSVFSISHFMPREDYRGEAYDLVLQCRTQAQKVINKGAQVVADYIYPQGESIPERGFRHETAAPPADDVSPYPFSTVNDYGRGKAVYIAGSIFKAYWEYNHHWLRQFIDAIIKHLDPMPLYKVDIPHTMETNLMRSNYGDLILNLINYQVGHQGEQACYPID